jgi:hypothetical protein
MALHIVVWDYIVFFSLETVAHCCTVVVAETIVRYYIVVVSRCYIVATVHVVFSLTQHAPYMHLMFSPSLSPKFCNPCPRFQLT